MVVERNPGLRCQIWEYPVDEQDEARRIYMMHGPYQFLKEDYPLSGSQKHPRRFQAHWFKSFPCLEYSPAKDAAFCFSCCLFSKKPSGRAGSDAFTVKGFRSWKKVKEGTQCAFLSHMGSDGNSAHSYNVKCFDNLKNQSGHIRHVFKKQYPEDIRRNRLRLKVSIDAVRWLAFQACAFRGHDESATSKNQGNFLELVKLLAAYDEEVKAVVLGNAPGNAKYTSPEIQKEILGTMAFNVQKAIRDEIGDAKFCLIVDESRREQMALVVRFVDQEGFIRERFLDVVHVHDTTSATLKQELYKNYALCYLSTNWMFIIFGGKDMTVLVTCVENGMDCKQNLLQCPYAYYVHCFAHQLQWCLLVREMMTFMPIK